MRELHPAVQAARAQVDKLLRSRLEMNPEQARRRVRVEITPDVEFAIMQWHGPDLHYPRLDQDGPMQVAGISFYAVNCLPEPGWRVLW